MKISNIGGKAIGIGGLSLLPGETATLPKGFEENPVIKFFEAKGFVKLEATTPAKVETPPAENKSDDDQNGKELTKEEVIAAIEKMKRGDLDALAAQVGIEVTPEDTVPTLRDKLTAYYQAQ